jgi:hypothetical protein
VRRGKEEIDLPAADEERKERCRRRLYLMMKILNEKRGNKI